MYSLAPVLFSFVAKHIYLPASEGLRFCIVKRCDEGQSWLYLLFPKSSILSVQSAFILQITFFKGLLFMVHDRVNWFPARSLYTNWSAFTMGASLKNHYEIVTISLHSSYQQKCKACPIFTIYKQFSGNRLIFLTFSTFLMLVFFSITFISTVCSFC